MAASRRQQAANQANAQHSTGPQTPEGKAQSAQNSLKHGLTAQGLVVDGESVDTEEVRRVAALFFAWIALLVVGSGITAAFSDYGAAGSASGMFSALGNIGPCYMPTAELPNLHPAVKLTYIVGMLAGRLEILPVLLLFSPRAWR